MIFLSRNDDIMMTIMIGLPEQKFIRREMSTLEAEAEAPEALVEDDSIA